MRLGCPRGSSAGRRKTEENVDCQRDDVVGDDCATHLHPQQGEDEDEEEEEEEERHDGG